MTLNISQVLDEAASDEIKKRFAVFVENLFEETPGGSIKPGDAVKMLQRALFTIIKARTAAEPVVTDLLKSVST
jgi:hypothetical protein